jgi:glycosyltransferase involved in cell wall biosynthesis
LYPTLADNCPLTVLESIACWLPVLSFNTWGIEEIIKHKKNWYISPYKDYDSLIKWFERILENKDKLDVSLDSKFTQEAMVDQYIDLYKTLVQNK